MFYTFFVWTWRAFERQRKPKQEQETTQKEEAKRESSEMVPNPRRKKAIGGWLLDASRDWSGSRWADQEAWMRNINKKWQKSQENFGRLRNSVIYSLHLFLRMMAAGRIYLSWSSVDCIAFSFFLPLLYHISLSWNQGRKREFWRTLIRDVETRGYKYKVIRSVPSSPQPSVTRD